MNEWMNEWMKLYKYGLESYLRMVVLVNFREADERVGPWNVCF